MSAFASVENASIKYRENTKFPEIEIDLSFITDTYAPIAKAIKNANCELIKDVSVVDTYIDESGKSITVRLIFSHGERTLTKEEVIDIVKGIVAELCNDGINLKNDFVV